jgi:putative FmdB family regulatory protein
MPLYEFECRACGRFEAARPMDRASSPLRCPTCRRTAPRVLSAVAIGHHARAPARTEPRHVVKRPASQQRSPPPPRPSAHAGHGRPWMMGH